jgi:hypothetical protein
MVFALRLDEPVLELPRDEALRLLEWLGLGRPEFGAIEVRVLLPLCRRRLWPEARNASPLRSRVQALATAISDRLDAIVSFG